MSAIEWFHCICIQPNSQYMVAMIISWHCCTLQSLHTCLIDTMQVQHVIYNGYSYNTYSHTLYTWSSGYSHTVLIVTACSHYSVTPWLAYTWSCSPGNPLLPSAPGSPGCPGRPGGPKIPLSPSLPGTPVAPFSPFGPGNPLSPLSPLLPKDQVA